MMSKDEKQKILHYTLPGPETTGADPICDFCSEPGPTHCFIADDVHLVMSNDVKNLILSSDPHWGACDRCAVLVKARDKQGLHERCMNEFKRRFGEEKDGISQMSLSIVQETMFWGAFTGKEHPVSAHQKIEI